MYGKHPKIIVRPECSKEKGLKGYTQSGEVHVCLNNHDNAEDVILTVEHEVLHFCIIKSADDWIPVKKQHWLIKRLMER